MGKASVVSDDFQKELEHLSSDFTNDNVGKKKSVSGAAPRASAAVATRPSQQQGGRASTAKKSRTLSLGGKGGSVSAALHTRRSSQGQRAPQGQRASQTMSPRQASLPGLIKGNAKGLRPSLTQRVSASPFSTPPMGNATVAGTTRTSTVPRTSQQHQHRRSSRVPHFVEPPRSSRSSQYSYGSKSPPGSTGSHKSTVKRRPTGLPSDFARFSASAQVRRSAGWTADQYRKRSYASKTLLGSAGSRGSFRVSNVGNVGGQRGSIRVSKVMDGTGAGVRASTTAAASERERGSQRDAFMMNPAGSSSSLSQAATVPIRRSYASSSLKQDNTPYRSSRASSALLLAELDRIERGSRGSMGSRMSSPRSPSVVSDTERRLEKAARVSRESRRLSKRQSAVGRVRSTGSIRGSNHVDRQGSVIGRGETSPSLSRRRSSAAERRKSFDPRSSSGHRSSSSSRSRKSATSASLSPKAPLSDICVPWGLGIKCRPKPGYVASLRSGRRWKRSRSLRCGDFRCDADGTHTDMCMDDWRQDANLVAVTNWDMEVLDKLRARTDLWNLEENPEQEGCATRIANRYRRQAKALTP